MKIALPNTSADAPALALVLALLAVDGLHFVFARALHGVLPPLTSVLFVLATATAQVSAFAAVKGKLNWRTFVHRAPFFLTIGTTGFPLISAGLQGGLTWPSLDAWPLLIVAARWRCGDQPLALLFVSAPVEDVAARAGADPDAGGDDRVVVDPDSPQPGRSK